MAEKPKKKFAVRIARVKPWQATTFLILCVFVYGLIIHGFFNMPIVQFAMKMGVMHRAPYFAVSFVEKGVSVEPVAPLTGFMPHESWKAWDFLFMQTGLQDPPRPLIQGGAGLAVVDVLGNLMSMIDQSGATIEKCRISGDDSRIVWQRHSEWFSSNLSGRNPLRLNFLHPPLRPDIPNWQRNPVEEVDFKISHNGDAAVFITLLKGQYGGWVDSGPPFVQWINLKTGESVELTSHTEPDFLVMEMQSGSQHWMNLLADISPDGRYVATCGSLRQWMGNDKIHLHDPVAGTEECISGNKGDNFILESGSDYCPVFHPDGRGLMYIRNEMSRESRSLLIYKDLETGEERTIDADISVWRHYLSYPAFMTPYFLLVQGESNRNPTILIVDRHTSEAGNRTLRSPKVTVGTMSTNPPIFEIDYTYTLENRENYRYYLLRQQWQEEYSMPTPLPGIEIFADSSNIGPDQLHVEFVSGQELMTDGDLWWIVHVGKDEPKNYIEPPWEEFDIIGSTGPI